MIEFDAESAIHGCAWCVITQVIGMHSAVDVIKDVVYAQFQSVRQSFTLFSQVVCSVDAPYLESLSVTVVLIVAFAATAPREADA